MGLAEILFIIFLVLKLTGNIDWSWIAVFSPLIIAYTLIGLVYLVIKVVNSSR